MKEFKGVFDTLQSVYEEYLNGSESGRFVVADGKFYEWVDEAWVLVTFQPITSWDIPIGEWKSDNVANPPTGLSVNVYDIISFENFLGNVITYALNVDLYEIKDGIATAVVPVEPTYTENEYTIPTVTQIKDIPLLRYQLEPVDTIEELYLAYPRGGERGWYAMVTSLNVFVFWDVALGSWEVMSGQQEYVSVIRETPQGEVNGGNRVFTLSQEPVEKSLIFTVSGISRDYTLNGNIVTLPFAPAIGSIVRAYYFKHLALLEITVSDIQDLGTAATKDIEFFEQRELNPQFTNSINTINVDCNNKIQYDTNSGTTDAQLSFSNLPTKSIENLLIVDNNRATAFNLIIPTVDIVSGGITYKFRNLLESPLEIPIGASGELSILFIFKSPTVCEIRINGDATQEDLLASMDTITGGTMPNGGTVILTIDSDKTGYVLLPNGTLLTTVAGVIDEAYTGVGGAITYYIPKNNIIVDVNESSLTGEILFKGTSSSQFSCTDCFLSSVVLINCKDLSASTNTLTAKSIGDVLYEMYLADYSTVYVEVNYNAIESEVDTYLQATYGITYATVYTRLVTTNGGTILIDTV